MWHSQPWPACHHTRARGARWQAAAGTTLAPPVSPQSIPLQRQHGRAAMRLSFNGYASRASFLNEKCSCHAVRYSDMRPSVTVIVLALTLAFFCLVSNASPVLTSDTSDHAKMIVNHLSQVMEQSFAALNHVQHATARLMVMHGAPASRVHIDRPTASCIKGQAQSLCHAQVRHLKCAGPLLKSLPPALWPCSAIPM